MKVKLIDFGSAFKIRPKRFSVLHTTHPDAFDGTEIYAAPEVIWSKEYDPTKADIYSLGLTAYEVITKRPLFKAINDLRKLLVSIRDDDLRPEYDRTLGVRFNELLWYAWHKQPSLRPSAGALFDRFSELLKIPTPDHSIWNTIGWVGAVDGKEAEVCLKDQTPRTFLTRYSTSEGCYVISIKKVSISHKKVIEEGSGYYIPAKSQSEDAAWRNDISGANLSEIITKLMQMGLLMTPIVLDQSRTRYSNS